MPTELDRVLADAVSDVTLASSAHIRQRGDRRRRRNAIATGLGAIVAVAGVLLATGLTTNSPAPTAAWSASDADPVFQRRAVQVADAWQALNLTDAWTNGFVPLAPFTIAPQGGFRDIDNKTAFMNLSLRLTVTLPDATAEATVAFADSRTMTVPIVGAATAYRDLLAGKSATPICTGKCPELTVTEATLGTAQVLTSRGLATVPAWHFHVSGIAAPIVRVAVAPQAVTPIPVSTLTPADAVLASSLSGVGERSIKYLLNRGPCEADPQPQVWESAEVIVIGGLRNPPTRTMCPNSLISVAVEVTLTRPVGNRIILDVVTGRPWARPTATVR